MTDSLSQYCPNCEAQANTIEELRAANERWVIAFKQAEERANGRIEALQADREKLREALGWFLNDSRFVVQVGGNPYAVPQMIEDAREALQETSDEQG